MDKIKHIKIDQIRFNIPITLDSFDTTGVPDEILAINRLFHFKVIFGYPLKKTTGKNGYTYSILWGTSEQGGLISIMYNPRRIDMGILVDFTSTGKILYEELCELNNIEVNWRQIITKVYQMFKGHTSRIDIAIDFINWGYSVDKIYQKLFRGKYAFINPVKQKINFEHIQHVGRSNEVNTIYVGSRYSDAFLRIYNKKLEQMSNKGVYHSLANHCEDWVRVEGEFKNRECHNMGAMVTTLATDNIEPYLASYVFKHWKLVVNDDAEKS